ncbi:MAG: hypothetical protein EOO85_24615 [Pedobacter sp.]|nr:MAG: hypothetical protein EOO85_24615 [Pedobacter sp.]
MKISSTPGSPHASAMLELESTNRGFLPPRVFLTSNSMLLNGTTPANGTIVFSINWEDNERLGGLFVWKDVVWMRLDDSKKLSISHIRLVKNNDQNLGIGNNEITWNEISDVKQPQGDLPMWSLSTPAKVIIRRKGWYFVSSSCRMGDVLVGETRYLAIAHNGQQITASGYDNPGTAGTSNNVTLNTSTMVYCEINDELVTLNFGNSPAAIKPFGLKTTQFNVTQLPTLPFF